MSKFVRIMIAVYMCMTKSYSLIKKGYEERSKSFNSHFSQTSMKDDEILSLKAVNIIKSLELISYYIHLEVFIKNIFVLSLHSDIVKKYVRNDLHCYIPGRITVPGSEDDLASPVIALAITSMRLIWVHLINHESKFELDSTIFLLKGLEYHQNKKHIIKYKPTQRYDCILYFRIYDDSKNELYYLRPNRTPQAYNELTKLIQGSIVGGIIILLCGFILAIPILASTMIDTGVARMYPKCFNLKSSNSTIFSGDTFEFTFEHFQNPYRIISYPIEFIENQVIYWQILATLWATMSHALVTNSDIMIYWQCFTEKLNEHINQTKSFF